MSVLIVKGDTPSRRAGEQDAVSREVGAFVPNRAGPDEWTHERPVPHPPLGADLKRRRQREHRVTAAVDAERRAVAAALGEAAEFEMREVGIEDRLEEQARVAEHVGGAQGSVENAERLLALGNAGEAAERHRPRGVVPAAAAGHGAGKQQRAGVVLQRHACLRQGAVALRAGRCLQGARLEAARRAQPPHVVERHLRAGGEQPGGLVKADLIGGGAAVEESRAGARPQALPFADDRGGVGAVDLAAQQAVGEGEAGIERGDLGVGVDLGRQLVERVLEFVEAADVEQAEQCRTERADAALYRSGRDWRRWRAGSG